MAGLGILLALLTTLIGAAFAVLSGSAAARARALLATVLGVGATIAAAGSDLVAVAALATGLGVNLLLHACEDPWTRAPRPRDDRRVLPATAAILAFAALYRVAVHPGWPQPAAPRPVALTSLVGARLLTSDVAVLVAVIVLVSGALVGAARIAGRETPP